MKLFRFDFISCKPFFTIGVGLNMWNERYKHFIFFIGSKIVSSFLWCFFGFGCIWQVKSITSKSEMHYYYYENSINTVHIHSTHYIRWFMSQTHVHIIMHIGSTFLKRKIQYWTTDKEQQYGSLDGLDLKIFFKR